MKKLLKRLFENERLNKEEAYQILTEIGCGKHKPTQITSFLSVYLMRKIEVEELAGFRQALLDLALKINLNEFNTIDLCGTGGDGKNTFNISTLASFVVAGTGQKVAKHGNYGVSSISGSSNMLENFGYKFTKNEDSLRRQTEQANICFLHAPLFHPAMKHVASIRKELGMKTIFNLLGPIVNPSSPQNQLVGVYNLDILTLYGELFKDLNINHSIVHSTDGYDEISLTSNFELIYNSKAQNLTPDDLKLPLYSEEELTGGDSIEDSAKIFISILEGNGNEAQNNVVLANAAYALKTVNNISFEDAFLIVKESLIEGKALKSFKTLIDLSK